MCNLWVNAVLQLPRKGPKFAFKITARSLRMMDCCSHIGLTLLPREARGANTSNEIYETKRYDPVSK